MMKHRIKASVLALAILHIVLGGAAIHAAIAWAFGRHADVTSNNSTQARTAPPSSNANTTVQVINER